MNAIKRHAINNTILLLDLMVHSPIRHKLGIRKLINDDKVQPTIAMEHVLVQKLYEDLHSLGLTVRENIVYNAAGEKVLEASPISVGNVKVTYLKYHPDIVAGRTRAGGPYFFKAVSYV